MCTLSVFVLKSYLLHIHIARAMVRVCVFVYLRRRRSLVLAGAAILTKYYEHVSMTSIVSTKYMSSKMFVLQLVHAPPFRSQLVT